MQEILAYMYFMTLRQGIRDVDVVIMLRLQKERMRGALLPSEHEYFQLFGLTEARLAAAKKDVIVMHPGPVNRGVEMDSQVADGPRSVILQQVSFGIAVRMAVMSMAMGSQAQGGAVKMNPGSCISIKNGRVIDPANSIDDIIDLHIAEGKILHLGAAPEGFHPDLTIDASGLVVCPGLVDLSARLREPGHEYKATLAKRNPGRSPRRYHHAMLSAGYRSGDRYRRDGYTGTQARSARRQRQSAAGGRIEQEPGRRSVE